MSYSQVISFDSSDRIVVDRKEERLPYHLAVPIWVSLAVVAWTPVILIIHSLTA